MVLLTVARRGPARQSIAGPHKAPRQWGFDSPAMHSRGESKMSQTVRDCLNIPCPDRAREGSQPKGTMPSVQREERRRRFYREDPRLPESRFQ